MKLKEPMKIIHKEQDIITAFALNQVGEQTSHRPNTPVALNWRKQKSQTKDLKKLFIIWLKDRNKIFISVIRYFVVKSHRHLFNIMSFVIWICIGFVDWFLTFISLTYSIMSLSRQFQTIWKFSAYIFFKNNIDSMFFVKWIIWSRLGDKWWIY